MVAGRPKRAAAGFAPLESAVMNAVWAADHPVSVREVLDSLNQGRSEPLAYTTVMTVMNRLTKKRALIRSGSPRRYAYEAAGDDAAPTAERRVGLPVVAGHLLGEPGGQQVQHAAAEGHERFSRRLRARSPRAASTASS